MIKVLVVDDSPLMRKVLRDVLNAADDLEVAVARDGLEAIAQLHAFQPDVVTLDVQMPQMDGLACLDRIMVERPCPVVMVSALTEAGADVTLEALQRGAVDFIAKPAGTISLSLDEFGPALRDRVRAASRARLRRTLRLTERVRLRAQSATAQSATAQSATAQSATAQSATAQSATTQSATTQSATTQSATAQSVTVRPPARPAATARPVEPPCAPMPLQSVVLVGTSTGGPPALDALLAPLPADFPWPILVAQHMPASFTGSLARRLDRLCALQVVEVTRPMPLAPGTVYIGRGDADLIIGQRPTGPITLAAAASAEHRWHPSVDRLVASAMAQLEPAHLIGVLMTGMGNDGASAMTKLRAAGGRVIAEAEETAVVWGMPGELVRAGGADVVAPLDGIARQLLDWLP